MASNVVSDNFETSSGGVPQLGGTGATTCKAWVNFNGTGTVAIRDSYNVSSITDVAVGKYTINFSTAMANSDYSLAGGARPNGGVYSWFMEENNAPVRTTSTVKIAVSKHDNTVSVDCVYISAQVFGD